jgi:hypothetical protein
VQQALSGVNAAVNTPKVTSLQGLTGNVTLTAGSGISISGTKITNDGVISLVSGSGTLTVTDDGNGNYTITEAGSGASGTVALGPLSAQADASNNPSIHVDKTGTGNFLQFANNGTDTFVVNQTGQITTGTINYTQVQGRPATVVNSIGGASGALTLGTGLAVAGTTLSNSGVTSLTGTASQITVSAATGGVTLSLPQNIATTSSPVFAGLRLSGLSTGLVTSNGTGVLASGVIDRNSGTYFSGTLSVSNGGTGAANFAQNGVLLGNNTNPLQVVTSAGAGLCFMSTAGAPVFQS